MSNYINITPVPETTEAFIPELTADPVSPDPEQTWVLRTGMPAGTPIGLLLALTYPGFSYQLSYKTLEGPIVRVPLT